MFILRGILNVFLVLFTPFARIVYSRLNSSKMFLQRKVLDHNCNIDSHLISFTSVHATALERFLRRVVIHPELFDASCLLTFLKADDMTFQHAKNVSQQMDSSNTSGNLDMSASLGGAGAFNLAPKNTSGIKKWFSEAKTTLSNDLVTSPDDDLFDEIERYIEALAIQMKRVSNQATGMVRKSKELAHGFFEFGLAFHQLGQSEGEALGKKLELMGGTADTLSAMASSHADQEWKKLDEPFRDYLKTIQAVKLALNRRHDKRVSYTALLHEIQTREGNLHRLRMTPGSEGKAYSTEMSLQRYQAAAEVAREEYAECSQRVLREVDRFKREKADEMKLVVLDFIMLEIKVNREMEKIWGELVPQLEEGSLGGDFPIPSGSPMPQQQLQPTMVNMPPSQPPPPLPPMPSQPMYSNVPALTGSESLMESSIQYRDNNLPGMGL